MRAIKDQAVNPLLPHLSAADRLLAKVPSAQTIPTPWAPIDLRGEPNMEPEKTPLNDQMLKGPEQYTNVFQVQFKEVIQREMFKKQVFSYLVTCKQTIQANAKATQAKRHLLTTTTHWLKISFS